METLKNVLRYVFAVIAPVSGALTILDHVGVALPGLLGVVADNSFWLFPASMFALGYIIGWGMRARALREDGVCVYSVTEMAKDLAEAKRDLGDVRVELRAAKARLHAAGIKTEGGLYGELVKASERFEESNGIKPAS